MRPLMLRLSLLSLLLVGAAGLPVPAFALPDLYVPPTPLTLSRPGVAPGDTVTLGAWLIQNLGDATAETIEVGYYLSPDQTITSADVLLGSFALPGGLADSAVYNVGPTTLTIPGDVAPHVWYVGPLVDHTHAIAENNEANNFNKVALDLLGPDLDIVGTLTAAPSSVAPGDTVLMGWTIQNTDSAGAGPSAVAIYLSANSQIDTSDVLLAELPTDSLPPGATQVYSAVPVVVPLSTPASSPILIAFTDDNQVVVETNENNNTATRMIRVGPDLTITSGAPAVDPDTVTVGDSITVAAWTTRNDGAQAAGISFGGYRLSVNSVIGDGDDIVLGSVETPALEPDASHTHPAIRLEIPPGTLPGTYVFGLFTDHTNQVAEHTESNNTVRTFGTSFTPHLVVVGPDLLNGSLAADPTALAPGMATLVSWALANVGSSASAACSLGFYLSTDSSYCTCDVLLTRRGLAALADAAVEDDTLTIVIPETTEPGRYWLLSVADDLAQVAEVNENNNKRAVAITVGPNLVPSAGSGLTLTPSAVLPGGTVKLSPFDVTNTGAVGTGPFVIGFYLSSNNSINASDLLLTTLLVGGLGPGQTASFDSTELVIPSDSQPGNRFVGLWVDKNVQIDEFDEPDNDLATAITLFGPDLVLVSTELVLDAYESGPYGPTQGFPLSISAIEIANAGTWESPACGYGLYFSPDASITTGDLLVATGTLPALGIGANHVIPADTIDVPGGQDLGPQYFGILLDHTNVVREIADSPNHLSAPITIHTQVGVEDGAPGAIRLAPPTPNPARGAVSFRLGLPRESDVSLELFDYAGRRVRAISSRYGPGEHAIVWDGRDARGQAVGSGVYLYRLRAGDRTFTGRLAFMR